MREYLPPLAAQVGAVGAEDVVDDDKEEELDVAVDVGTSVDVDDKTSEDVDDEDTAVENVDGALDGDVLVDEELVEV